MFLDKASFDRLVDNLSDGVYIVDKDRSILFWNKAAERITGFRADEVIGQSCANSILTHVDAAGIPLCNGLCPLAETILDQQARQAEIFLHHKNGHRIPVSVRTSILTDDAGRIVGGVELFTDRSNLQQIRARIKELEELAMLDRLTQLANRICIERELFIRLEEHRRFGVPFGFLFMDIDHFKRFNDTYGHDVGDSVLKFVADTLAVNARPFDMIARWGGEEFVGVIRNVRQGELVEIGNRLRILVESSYIDIDAQRLQVCISVGATLVRQDDDIDSLVKRADTLLYQSKAAGRNRLTLG